MVRKETNFSANEWIPKKEDGVVPWDSKQYYEEGVIYAFTCNPKMQYDLHTDRHHRPSLEVEHFINCIARHIKHACHFKVVPEMSHFGRWHWHGVIKLTDVFEFYSSCLPLLVSKSSFKICPITDSDGWSSYMYKNQKIMEEGCLYNDIPYEVTPQTKMDETEERVDCDACEKKKAQNLGRLLKKSKRYPRPVSEL